MGPSEDSQPRVGRGAPPVSSGRRCRARATKRGEERTPLRSRLRRADLRRQLRRPGGRARAGRQRRRRAGHRPLRDRRAPDLGLRDPHRVADALEPAGVAAADLRRAGHPHPARHRPLRPAVDVLDVRLPHAVRAAGRAGRSFEFETAKVDGPHGPHGAHRPRRDPRAADRRRARLAPGARARRATSSRPTRCSPAGSRSTRSAPATDLEVWIDRCYVPAGYGWSFPADGELRIGVGSFDPRFHVKEPTVRLAERPRRRRGPLPGQLDPPRAARRPPRTACSSSATRPATACR